MRSRFISPRLRMLLPALIAVSAGCMAFAQDLGSYIPAGSLLNVTFLQDGEVAQDLREELMALDWETSLETFNDLAMVYGSAWDMEEFLEMFRESDPDFSGMLPDCPDLAVSLEELTSRGTGEVLVSVGFTPMNPLPALTGVVRGDHRALVSQAVACATDLDDVEITTQDQDGVPLHTISVDYSAPFAIAATADVLLMSSSPDMVRTALRLAGGAAEPTLADSPLYQDSLAFRQGNASISWTMDYTSLSPLVQMFGPQLGEEPEVVSLVERVVNMLNTVGGHSGGIQATDSGLLIEYQTRPDAAGGDNALYSLLQHEGLSITDIPVLPTGAVASGSGVMNMQAAADYLDGWFQDVARLLGETSGEMNLRTFLLEETGFDLETELLSWLGNRYHYVQLDYSFTGAESIFPGTPMAFMVEVTDPAAAMDRVQNLATMTAGAMTDFYELSGDDLQFDLAVREESYGGHDVLRILAGPVTSLSFAVLDNHLVIAMPATALHTVIDAHAAGLSGPVPGVPGGADLVSAYHHATGADLLAASRALEQMVQPIAYGVRAAALEEQRYAAEWDGFDWDDYDWDAQDWSSDTEYGQVPMTGITPSQLGSGTATGTLEAGLPTYFLLTDVQPGVEFTVSAQSPEFDGYLQLIEVSTGRVVAYNDDYGDTRNPTIVFANAKPGMDYAVEVTAYWSEESGSFTVSFENTGLAGDSGADEATEVEEDAVVEAEVPSFQRLIEAMEIFPDALAVIAARAGDSISYEERNDGGIYGRMVLNIDW